MPNPPWDHPSPSPDDEVEALLSGRAPGSPPSAELHRVAEVVAALTAPASEDEMRGLDGALHLYRARFGMSRTTPARRRRRAALVAGVAAGVVAVSGSAAAALSGSLPGPVQNFAHHAIGAPPAETATPTQAALTRSSSHAAPGRSVAASAPPTAVAARLCTAYLDAQRHRDTAFQHSTAFGRLITLAGGWDAVAGYCATAAPAPSASHPAHPTPSGRPTSRPTHPHGPPSTPPGEAGTHTPNPHASSAPPHPTHPAKPTG